MEENILHIENDPTHTALKEIECILENSQKREKDAIPFYSLVPVLENMQHALITIMKDERYTIKYVEGPTITSGPFHYLVKKDYLLNNTGLLIAITNRQYYLVIQKKKTIPNVIVGATYINYRGNKYKVLAIACNEHAIDNGNRDNLQVVYQAQFDIPGFGWHPTFICPISTFTEDIIVEGEKIARFSIVKEPVQNSNNDIGYTSG